MLFPQHPGDFAWTIAVQTPSIDLLHYSRSLVIDNPFGTILRVLLVAIRRFGAKVLPGVPLESHHISNLLRSIPDVPFVE
ncbi:hypothetical protein SDC9_208268 [bioreactor metagenome]|uniref:Uncharacterized protein n=1 Tax=bioreactor metagenome TaxID=1076179 RepID=A0A645JBT6_9ZZZZ